MISRTIVSLFLLLTGVLASAQSETSGSILQEKIRFLEASYDSIFNTETELINGRACYPEGDSVNHPFFGQNGWRQGQIYYHNNIYSFSHLKYDLSSDHLVGMFVTGELSYPVILNREAVQEFVLNTHHFRYLEDTVTVRKKIIKPGYYEILYEGKSCLYLKWIKSKESDRFTLQTIYPETVLFLIRKEGKVKNITNSRDFFGALGHEKELKAFLLKNNIQFRRKEFASFAKVLQYYDSL